MRCSCGGVVDIEHSCDFFRAWGVERSVWMLWKEGRYDSTRGVAVDHTETPIVKDTTIPDVVSSSVVSADTFVIDT